jgi:hypothetical protein
MEALQREEKLEKRNEPGFTTYPTKTIIAFPIKSDGLVYSELLDIIKAGGVQSLSQS